MGTFGKWRQLHSHNRHFQVSVDSRMVLSLLVDRLDTCAIRLVLLVAEVAVVGIINDAPNAMMMSVQYGRYL